MTCTDKTHLKEIMSILEQNAIHRAGYGSYEEAISAYLADHQDISEEVYELCAHILPWHYLVMNYSCIKNTFLRGIKYSPDNKVYWANITYYMTDYALPSDDDMIEFFDTFAEHISCSQSI